MSDKDFKVKNKLIVNGLDNASGVVLATNNQLDSHTLLPTQYGGTGTTTSPTSGQIPYSASGSTYAPTTLASLLPNAIQGTTGPQGLIGVQGINGIQGTTGVQGNDGTQGLTGIQGSIGLQGFGLS